MKIKDTKTALGTFEEFALKHEIATNNGDYKTANKSYDKIIKSIEFLKKEGQIELLELFLEHDSLGVKSWAATYLLPVLEGKATDILSDIAKDSGIRGFAAQTTLNEWKKGNLKL